MEGWHRFNNFSLSSPQPFTFTILASGGDQKVLVSIGCDKARQDGGNRSGEGTWWHGKRPCSTKNTL